jgi:hypothetical protein
MAEMKKLLNILMAALVAFGAALPISQVARAEDPPPEEEVIEIQLTINGCHPSDTDCLGQHFDGELEYSYQFNVVGNGVDADPMLGVHVDCSTEDCDTTWDIYYEISGESVWSKDGGYPNEGMAAVDVNADSRTVWISCGGPYEGHCHFLVYGMFTFQENPGYHVQDFYTKFTSACGNWLCSGSLEYTIKLSASPITDCADYEDENEIASGTLDPTNESGDLVTLETGEEYRVTISGGPWNDPSNDRYDAAVKNGEEDWMAVGDFIADEEGPVECVGQDEEDETGVSFVITAEDADFRIRVNDIVGSFADNTGSLDYSVTSVLDVGSLPTCEDSFLAMGDPFYSNTITASDAAGELAFTKLVNGRPAVGDYIAITFTGSWQDDGVGDELQDVALKVGTGAWTPLATTEGFMCSSVDGVNAEISTYYMQVISPLAHYLRVDDDASWAMNTGTVSFTTSLVVYTPPVSGCGMDYKLVSNIGNLSAPANSSAGVKFTFDFDVLTINGTPGEPMIFAIETDGSYIDNGVPVVAGGMGEFTTNMLYEPMETFSDALCIEELDPLGHVRVYVAVDPLRPSWYFRAEDDDYEENTGSLGFKFYQADYLRVDDPPIGDPCGSQFQKGPLVIEKTISATTSFVYLDILQPGQYYAIETTDGPWYDNGAPSNWVAMATTTFGSPTILTPFTELTEFALCSQDSEEVYKTAFIYTTPGYSYFVRVYDDYLDLADNTGSINVKIYSATNDGGTWETCADAYSLAQIPTDDTKALVPGNQSKGAKIQYITTGTTYAVEITGDYYWSDPDVEASYLAEICEAGVLGTCSDWVPLSEAEEAGIVDCVVVADTTKPTYRVYFNVAQPLYLRVADDDGNFDENSGKLTYDVYGPNINGPIVYPEDPIPGWEVSCYTSCLAPTGAFTTLAVSFGDIGTVNLPLPNVGGWISYGTCAVISYFTWCPEHTEALKGAGRSISDTVEPIATMNDMIDFVQAAKARFDAVQPYISASSMFSSSGEVGGAPRTMEDINGNPPDAPVVYAQYPIDLFLGDEMDITANNPWFGGTLDLSVEQVEAADRQAIIDTCVAGGLSYSVGEGAATMVCQLHYLITTSKFFLALITIMDVVIIGFIVFRYLPAYVKRFFNLIIGNKSIVSDIIG